MSRRRAPARAKKSRLGSFLVLVGCLGVLGVVFGAGLFVGRGNLRPRSGGAPAAAHAGRESSARRGEPRAPDRASRDPIPSPVLTFYQDLTAPLTAPPPPPPRPRGAKPAGEHGERSGADGGHAEKRATGAAVTDKTPAEIFAGAAGTAKFTVQVGAFNERAQAERLRATLAAAGQDAYIAEREAAGVSRFRVRVGTYASREEAQAAAQRLAAERHVGTYVTAR